MLAANNSARPIPIMWDDTILEFGPVCSAGLVIFNDIWLIALLGRVYRRVMWAPLLGSAQGETIGDQAESSKGGEVIQDRRHRSTCLSRCVAHNAGHGFRLSRPGCYRFPATFA